ncbi:MAG: histidinol-phosphate transaminase [Mariprofundales bacterium]
MIRTEIRSLRAYYAPDADGMIKLDAMENPYSMPDTLQQQWAAFMAKQNINRYPDSNMFALRAAIAELDDLKPEQVLLGNGSDEIIQMLLIASDAGTCVVPTPSFVMYSLIARWLKRPVATVPLTKDFALSPRSVLQVCAREKAALLFLACPNNPTGNLWDTDTIAEIAHGFRGLVVIDEAYLAFSGRSHTHLIANNVIILRTFSKMGWAGLRLGYALGTVEMIAELNKVRMPYNINTLTDASARFLLAHYDVFLAQIRHIKKAREELSQALSSLNGVKVYPSQANFLTIRVPDADAIFNGLKQRKILIKNLHGSDVLLNNCLRISIGKREENTLLLQALKELLP